MIKNKELKTNLITYFVLLELSLLLTILLIDGEIKVYCFAAVLLAFAASFMFFNLKEKSYLTHVAMLFTVIADIFLVLVEPQMRGLAMTSFSVTQIMYFVRILLETPNKKIRLANIITLVCLVTIAEVATIIVIKDGMDYLATISMFYYSTIITNVIFAFINVKRNPLLAVGLLLFLFCDTFVGLEVMSSSYLSLNSSSIIYKLLQVDFNFVWFFYVPSQTLIALSLNKKVSK